ncbi:hypothetical protein C0995_001067 [Termitomyces sp. Mi166|nr:hypothetical protein C0995_001067 [Termitomyces sp. Mi166\
MQSQNEDLYQQLQEAHAGLEQKWKRVMAATSGSECLRKSEVQLQQEARAAEAELKHLQWATHSLSPEEEEEVQGTNVGVQTGKEEVPLTGVAPLTPIRDGQDTLVQ